MTSRADRLAHQQQKERGVGTNKRAVKFSGQDYETLRKECLRSGRLFEDDCFPAGSKSLGYEELGPYSFKTREVVWKRPKELCPDPKFIDGGATRTDICQGALGDCWLLAAIASLTLDQRILARVVPPDQTFTKDYAGIFHFQFWQFGEWVEVVVDDRLPTKDGKLLFVHSAQGSEFWSALLEKAYAKVNGCYEALAGGNTIEGFEDFTGGIAEAYALDKAPDDLFQIIQRALSLGSLMGCSIDITSAYETEEVTALKLVKGHAYSVTGAEEVSCRGKQVRLIRVRNPWGQVEWTGPWSDGSREWNDVSRDEKAKLNHVAEDGEFWMSYSDFIRQFTKLEICNLTPDTLESDDVGHWNQYQYEGMWRVGSTAGGCLNYAATFTSNPQFMVRLEDVDDDPVDGEDGCTFLLGLMQKDGRRYKRLDRSLETIGFAIYKVPEQLKGRSNVHLGPDILLRQRAVAMSSAFINTREVCDRFKLPPGEYAVIPSTFQPHKNGSFVLRVFSEKQAKTSPLEEDVDAQIEEKLICESDIDPNFKRTFQHIAGNDMEVSVFELVQILNNVVSKRCDIKTDGFSLETGHLIISLLDKDESGKLGLMEFHLLWNKIQKYLEIFRSHDKDNSGTMSSHEMRGAAHQAGFHVNSAVLQTIISRHADAQYAIDFDSFVGCLIKLEMLFKMFKSLEKDGSGTIKLDLQQAATTNSKSALNVTNKRTILPADFQFPPETLSQLSLKPSCSLSQEAQRRLSGEIGEGIGDYDYNNANDTANFCPGIQGGDSDDDVEGFAGSDDTQPSGDSIPPPSQDLEGISTYGEGDLVPEPHRVNKIEINYAKTAKKMDMKRLKNNMWTLLTESPQKPPQEMTPVAATPVAEVCGEKTFRETTKTLLNRLPNMMAQNLSVPLAFVALLHLANEKNLELVKVDDMSDIIIRQGQ